LRAQGRLSLAEEEPGLLAIQRSYGYHALTGRFDGKDDEFVVDGAMSAKRVVAKVPAPRPRDNVFIPLGPGAARVDPLVKRKLRYNPPLLWPPATADVRWIRTPSGRTSLYVRGHLISGWLSGPGTADNLTPITRTANARMERWTEGLAKRLASRRLKHRGVYSYTVHTEGTAGKRPPRRWVPLAPPGGRKGLRRVHAEKQLAKKVVMRLVRKRYNPSTKNWVNDRQLDSDWVRNVPPYPPGYLPRRMRWRPPPRATPPAPAAGGPGTTAAGAGGTTVPAVTAPPAPTGGGGPAPGGAGPGPGGGTGP
jgi:hypothetical protein